ncbi:hypothetical protein [Burkholderia sp. Nafp2/4-1b]|uniref:hypothetical protein n=1 Tax=Burkholderia sp. Nafp2/4-1b TaxID=2116686 RepID=UPI001969FC93|nr:hypothetical protein [Burkholderia sp. Nafp2/4-1b]
MRIANEVLIRHAPSALPQGVRSIVAPPPGGHAKAPKGRGSKIRSETVGVDRGAAGRASDAPSTRRKCAEKLESEYQAYCGVVTYVDIHRISVGATRLIGAIYNCRECHLFLRHYRQMLRQAVHDRNVAAVIAQIAAENLQVFQVAWATIRVKEALTSCLFPN